MPSPVTGSGTPNNTLTIYDPGDCLGGLQSFANFAVAGGLFRLTGYQLQDKISARPNGALLFFDANPTFSTFTDNAAYILHDADRAKLFHVEPIGAGDWVDLVVGAFAESKRLIDKTAFLPDGTLRVAFIFAERCLFASGTDNFHLRVDGET